MLRSFLYRISSAESWLCIKSSLYFASSASPAATSSRSEQPSQPEYSNDDIARENKTSQGDVNDIREPAQQKHPKQSRAPEQNPAPLMRRSYVDYMQEQLKKESSLGFLPTRLRRYVLQIQARFVRRPADRALHPELLMLLDKSAAQLYFDCSKTKHFLAYCEEFGLPDYFASWFRLTLMHVWMVLFRLHVSLDAPSYMRFQHAILAAMWDDVDRRVKIVDKFTKQMPHSTEDMKGAQAMFIQTFLEYDEAFLCDDRAMAAAVWRNLYAGDTFDPIHVARVVRYMRASVAQLTATDVGDLLAKGVDRWEAAADFITSGNSTKT